MDPHRVLVLRGDNVEGLRDRLASFWRELQGQSGQLLFKPNLIHHRHLTGGDYGAVVTQPEILALAWEAADRLGLSGTRAVADAPQGDADFAAILEKTGLDTWGKDRGTKLVDLRRTQFEGTKEVVLRRRELPGDPAGAVLVNLGNLSSFYGVEGRTYYGADYDITYTNAHHVGETHEYLFSGTALQSQIIFNVPKLKTHKKAGVTLSMKNLVGLNADKNLLPHHSLGTPREGGDAYLESGSRQRFEASLLRSVKPLLARSVLASRAAGAVKPVARRVLGDTLDVVRSGNSWANDTIWRMILDLNRILLYARPDGALADSPQRRTIVLVDGLVAGEGNGPEAPDPLRTDLVVAGVDFVAVDIVASTFMGFDFRKIPHLVHALDPHPLPLTTIDPDDLTVESNVTEWDRNLWEIDPDALFRFRPHFGWRGRIEREVAPASVA
ncbi:MAG: DUF362 domain-containing protein [Actinomycetota bacterium]|nr:DUF362 domain-containing protein [Actinomycetota bacterium]